MAVRTRQDLFNVDTGINAHEIVPTSKMVSQITGFPVQPNKAIVGANAFAHESGIHQDGVLKHRETYEIMSAEDVGWHTNRMVLGKHSGRAAFRARLDELGISFASEAAMNEAFQRFKDLADKKHEVFDEDLQALVSDTKKAAEEEHYKLVLLEATARTGETPEARVVLNLLARSHGHGHWSWPRRRGLQGHRIHGAKPALLYSVNAITAGTDSQGEVTVRLEKGGRIVNGHGADTDIITASAKAYLNALNHFAAGLERAHPQALRRRMNIPTRDSGVRQRCQHRGIFP